MNNPTVTWNGQRVPFAYVVLVDLGPLLRRKDRINRKKTAERTARDVLFLEHLRMVLARMDAVTRAIFTKTGVHETCLAVPKSYDGELGSAHDGIRCRGEGASGVDPFWPRYPLLSSGAWEYYRQLTRARRAPAIVDAFLAAFLAQWRVSVGLPRSSKTLRPEDVLAFLAK